MRNLYHGECLAIMDKLIADGVKVDAIITDPPYGTTSCKWDSVIPFDEMWQRVKQLRKDRTPIVLFGSEPFSSVLRMSNIKEYKYDWKWIKDHGSNFGVAKYRPINISEDIIIFSLKTISYNPQMRIADKKSNKGGKNKIKKTSVYGNNGFKNSYRDTKIKFPINTINFNTPKHNDKKNGSLHPTQKNVDLMEYLIKTYTNENETVLDFTMGSGTTGVACVNLNRNFIGIELDAEYFKIAEKRIAEATRNQQGNLF